MSISSINPYGSQYLSGNSASGAEKPSSGAQETVSASSSRAAASVRNKAAQAYGAGMTSTVGQAAVKRAISEIQQLGGSDRVTFDMIREHREKLEKELSVLISGGLMLEGVDPETEFTLVATPEGAIEVNCADQAQKEKIEKFLEENPKVGEQFLYVQALGNLERAQASSGSIRNWSAMRDTKMQLESQAIEMFFAAAQESGMGFASLVGEFSGEGGSFMLGADIMV